MIFITGDTHGTLDIGKLPSYFAGRNDLAKDDYLIICGDVAVCGFSGIDSAETRRILRNLPVTVLFCDGNHENFNDLEDFPVEKWQGGDVHFIDDDIIHLMRGQIYDIEGKSFLVCGGAFSVDYMDRVDGATWFSDREMPSQEEYNILWRNLEKANYKVDYIITHTGPSEVLEELGYATFDEEERLKEEFQEIAENVDFKAWFFGHLHEDNNVDNRFFALFNDVLCLEDIE